MPRILFDGDPWDIDKLPNECPHCHHAIDVRNRGGVIRSTSPMGRTVGEVSFQCPNDECLRLFIGRYLGEYSHATNGTVLRLRATTPYVPDVPSHSEEVIKLSPQFVEVFRQAAAAEAWNLPDVAGCGYRKALEFLIKDYCIANAPKDADAIKGKLLGRVIQDHVADGGIKACAERAAWLGNDETHYVRRWEEHDIADLKRLLSLSESWITTSERTKAYLAGMPVK